MKYKREGGGGGGSGGTGYGVKYANTVDLALPATGSPYSPDGTPVINGDKVLFTGFTVTTDRGVYQATVVAGDVTAWTRIVYNPNSPLGESLQGDFIFVSSGATYLLNQFLCIDTPTHEWVNWVITSALHTLKNEVWINPLVPEIPGEQYKTYDDAVTFILTQSPSATNKWVISCATEIGAGLPSITLYPYIYVDLHSAGFISCPVYSLTGFIGDLYAYQIKNGEVQDLRTDLLYMESCLVSGATMPTGFAYFSNNTNYYGGDFSATPSIAQISNGNIFGGDFSGGFSINNVQMTDGISGIIPGHPDIILGGNGGGGGFSYSQCSISCSNNKVLFINCLGNLIDCFTSGFVVPSIAGGQVRLINTSMLSGPTPTIPPNLHTIGYEQTLTGQKIYGNNFNIIANVVPPTVRVEGFQVPPSLYPADAFNGQKIITGGGGTGLTAWFKTDDRMYDVTNSPVVFSGNNYYGVNMGGDILTSLWLNNFNSNPTIFKDDGVVTPKIANYFNGFDSTIYVYAINCPATGTKLTIYSALDSAQILAGVQANLDPAATIDASEVAFTQNPTTKVYTNVMTLAICPTSAFPTAFTPAAMTMTTVVYQADNTGIVSNTYYLINQCEVIAPHTARLYVDDIIGTLVAGAIVEIKSITNPTFTTLNGVYIITAMGTDPVYGNYIEYITSLGVTALGNSNGGFVDTVGNYTVYTMYGGQTAIASCPIMTPYLASGGIETVVGDFNRDPYFTGAFELAGQINTLSNHKTWAGHQLLGTGVVLFEGVKFDSGSGKWVVPTTVDEIQGIVIDAGTSKKVAFQGTVILSGILPPLGQLYFDPTTFMLTSTPSAVKAGYSYNDANLGQMLAVHIEASSSNGSIPSTTQARIPNNTDDGFGNSSTGITFTVPYFWYDSAAKKLYLCVTNSANTAVWQEVPSYLYQNTLLTRFEFLDGSATSDFCQLPDPTTSPIQEVVVYCLNNTYPCYVQPNGAIDHFVYPGMQYRSQTYPNYIFKQTGMVRFITNGTDWYVNESGLDRMESRTTILDQYINSFGKEWKADAGNTGTVAWGTDVYGSLVLETGTTLNDYMRWDWGGAKRINLNMSYPSFDLKCAHNFLNKTNRTVGYQLTGTTVRLNIDNITGLTMGKPVVISDIPGGTLPSYYQGPFYITASGTDGNGPYIEYTIGAGHGPDTYTVYSSGYVGVPYTTFEFGFEADYNHYVKVYRSPLSNFWILEANDGGTLTYGSSSYAANDGTWERLQLYYEALGSGVGTASIVFRINEHEEIRINNSAGGFPMAASMQPYFQIKTDATAKANLLVAMSEVAFNNI